jgi:hypothetical protein
MNFLYQRLPKDLVYIIEDYAKDRTNYDKVIDELHKRHGTCLGYHPDDYWFFHFPYKEVKLNSKLFCISSECKNKLHKEKCFAILVMKENSNQKISSGEWHGEIIFKRFNF